MNNILLLLSAILAMHCTFAQSGTIISIAGTDSTGYNGDSRAAITAWLNRPWQLAHTKQGDLLFCDGYNNRVRKINRVTGIITTIAGTGNSSLSVDGMPATATNFLIPGGIVVDSGGNIFISETGGNRIRKINAMSGMVSTIAGTGTAGFYGDGIPALSAKFDGPCVLFLHRNRYLFCVDEGNCAIRKIDLESGIITTVAGNGIWASSPDGTTATNASLYRPLHVCVDDTDNIYISECLGNKVRKIPVSTGLLITVAGNGLAGMGGDGGLAVNANLDGPTGIHIDTAGNLFIADRYNGAIRKVDAHTGNISTIAGVLGSFGYAGDNGPATAAKIDPTVMLFDSSGNITFSEFDNNRIRRICYDTACLRIPDTTTAVNELASFVPPHYTLYPNPASSLLHLTQQQPGSAQAQVTVYDVVGNKLLAYQARFQNHTCAIDVSSLPPGIYLLQLTNNNGSTWKQRFVVQ